jgi:3-dehydroquinate dehydratase-1
MLDERQNVGQLLGLISKKEPDLVEFRLDKLSNFGTLETIAREKTVPAIATEKSNRDSAMREKLLLGAASAGFDFVDIDLGSPPRPPIRDLKSLGAKVIVSFHDLSKTPSPKELNQVLNSEIRAGGDVCKIVTTALSAHDNLSVLHFVEEKAGQTRLVSFAMGRHGIPSRVLSPIFCAEFTFASLTEADQTAD